MKNFNYFEITEGGMNIIEDIQSEKDLKILTGWMDYFCVFEDKEMIKWMEQAKIGQKFNHRLGVLVRMEDEVER